MEGDVSELTNTQIEERLRELEHVYAEFFEGGADAHELHHIHKCIFELQQELGRRKHN